MTSQEWNTDCTIARNNFSLQIIHNLRNKIVNTKKTKNNRTQTQRKNESHLRITVHLYKELPTCSKLPT